MPIHGLGSGGSHGVSGSLSGLGPGAPVAGGHPRGQHRQGGGLRGNGAPGRGKYLLIRELADIENASENEEVKLKAILATLTTLNYKYEESRSGLLREREVVGGTKIRFQYEGLNLCMEEVGSGSAWISQRARAHPRFRRNGLGTHFTTY